MSLLFFRYHDLKSSSSLKVVYFLLDHTSSKTTISWSFHNIMYISLLGELSECKKFSALTSDKDFFTRYVAMTSLFRMDVVKHTYVKYDKWLWFFWLIYVEFLFILALLLMFVSNCSDRIVNDKLMTHFLCRWPLVICVIWWSSLSLLIWSHQT